MDVDTCLLTAVIARGDIDKVLAEGITPEYFRKELAPVFKLCQEYYLKYGNAPSLAVVQDKFPDFEPDLGVQEPTQFFVDAVRDKQRRITLVETLSEAKKALDVDTNEATKVIEHGMSKVNIAFARRKDLDVSAGVDEREKAYHLRKQAGGVTGIPSGFAMLDKYLLGWQEQDMVTVTARQGTGKTWFLLKVLTHAWNCGHPVLMVTKEMATIQIIGRLDALLAQVPYQSFREAQLTHEEEQRLAKYWHELKTQAKPSFVVSGDDELEGGGVLAVRTLIEQYRPHLVGVDGLYLLRPDRRSGSMWEEITRITRDMKRVARSCAVPIIGTTQASRSSSSRFGPQLESISYSDSFGADSDVVIALHQTQELREDKLMKVMVLKSRESERPQFEVGWDLDGMDFREAWEPTSDADKLEVDELDDFEERLLY